MNERIDKLLVKAGAYFGGEGVDYSNFEPKKFAELIVQECIQVCNSRVGNSDYNTGRMHCASDLKEHFGVEE